MVTDEMLAALRDNEVGLFRLWSRYVYRLWAKERLWQGTDGNLERVTVAAGTEELPCPFKDS